MQPATSARRAETLVVDAAPLLQSPASLRGLAARYVTTQAVIDEIRDTTSRDLLASAEWLGLATGEQASGLQVRSPTMEALARVTGFARQTGDIAVLSAADLAVLALALTVEVEANGWRRVREAPGKLSQEEIENPPAPAQPKKRRNRKRAKTQPVEATPASQADDAGAVKPTEEVADALSDLELSGADEGGEDIPSASAAESASEDDDEDAGDWITPSNVDQHKSRDLGLFDSLERGTAELPAQPLACACITGDFAMQNVLIQMGLDVIGVGGKRVREVRTWVLRCHGCFRICKDPTKKFCPSCGGPTLTRTSITYVPPTAENPKGYVLHLKAGYQYRLRGTVYSLPSPLKANAKGAARDELILREDQKEWQRGVKKAEVAKRKEERAVARAMKDPSAPGGPRDPDWVPGMLVGEKGRRQPGEGRIGKDGLPIIGYGRRNPNEVRRKKR